jgi:hypothetical protein
MGIFNRLKRLWYLSEEPKDPFIGGIIRNGNTPYTTTGYMEVDEATSTSTSKPIGEATVVQDNPLEDFPDEVNPGEHND